MDFAFTPQQERFRQEVRQFLKKELPPDWRTKEWPAAWGDGYGEDDESLAIMRQFYRKLAAKRWLALSFPEEYGGSGCSPVEQLLFNEELSYHEAPPLQMAVWFIGPTILRYGSEEQKKEYLPKIASGEVIFCEGLSEPNSGSDLASLQTRATEDGDEFVLNGQKCWTSNGHHAAYCWLAARTGTQESRHKGISTFIIDMKTPGISLRPVVNMLGVHSFNDTFFEEARVPKNCILGQKNQGWEQVTTGLILERCTVTPFGLFQRFLEVLVDYTKQALGAGASSTLLRRLADMAIEIAVGRVLSYRAAWLLSTGQWPHHEAAILKLYSSEATQHLANVGMQLLGLYGQLGPDSKWTRLHGRVQRGYLGSVSSTIGAGTSEIERNLIAIRGLGLPR